MKKILLLTTFLLSLYGNSQNLFQESFSTFNTGVQLSGQGSWTNNSSNVGGSGSCTGVGCTNAFVNLAGLSYANYGSSTKSLQLLADKDGVGRGFTAVTAGDVYLAFVINLSNSTTSQTPNDFLRLASGGNFSTTLRMSIKNSGTGFVLGLAKNSGAATFTANTFSFNTDHLVVIKYSIVTGADNDGYSLFVNPTYSATEPSMMTAQFFSTTGVDASSSIDRIIFRQNATGTPTGKIGMISVSTTWAGLAFSTAGLANFEKGTFEVIGNQTSKGILSIKSAIDAENSIVNIYALNGALVASRSVNLSTTINEISINTLPIATPFVVEIVSENKRFSQKIISQ